MLSRTQIRMPQCGSFYSVNEANFDSFPEAYQRYISMLRNEHKSRYIGSFVADVHRTLTKGGVFLYAPTESHEQGKLRLLYEVSPLALVAEQAGGGASSGLQRVLEITPRTLHQRVPLVLGSQAEIKLFQQCRQFSGRIVPAEGAKAIARHV